MKSTAKVDVPDGARSWAVACAAFVINILLSGISRTTGLFYVALIDVYGITRMEANTPFTLRNIVRNLIGPLVGILGHRYGAREVTMAGGIFAGLGVALCAFAPDILWISIFWGVIHGIGVALGNTLFQVIINQHFNKHRATACGFAYSGGCVGSFIFPVVLEYMLNHIGLPGAFLITGAIILHVTPAGIFMKEPPWIGTAVSKIISNSETAKNAHMTNLSKSLPMAKHQTLSKIGSSKNKQDDIFIIAFTRKQSNEGIMCHQTLEDMHEKEMNGTEQKNDQILPHSASSENSTVSIYEGFIHMCCDPLFYMISLSLTAFVILFDLYLSTIVDYVKDKGIPEDSGKYFISLLSIGDFFGRLCFGWVTDKNYVSIPKFMMLVHVVQGLTFGALASVSSINILMALVVVCGLAGGANVVMYPSLVAKYLPTVQSLGIGSISFVGGIVQLGIPPMIGYFRDEIGSYDGLYLIIGGLSSVVGFLWVLEPVSIKLRNKINCWRRSRTAQNELNGNVI